MIKFKEFVRSLLVNLSVIDQRTWISSWLKGQRINSFVINEDLSVSVIGDVNIHMGKPLYGCNELPVKFRDVSGNFNCSNNYLKSLAGCPVRVIGNFSCADNKLKDMVGSPIEVCGYFSCNNNEYLDEIFKRMSFLEIRLYVDNNNLNEFLSEDLVIGNKGILGKKI